MGSVVKSIGKVFKKIGKGIKKIVKKIGPALIIAAAVYAGVAFYGASINGVTGIGSLAPSNFMTGLGKMTAGVKNFFMPQTGGVTQAAGMGTQAAGVGAQAAAAGNVMSTGAKAAMIGSTQAAMGATPAAVAMSTTNAMTAAGTVIPRLASSVAGGMTTGDALMYMTKMNMLSGGLKMVAGFFDDSEKKQMEHEKSLLSMKYAYGKPMTDEQRAFKEANPDWISQHPAMQGQDLYTSPNLMQSQTMASLPTQGTTPSPYIQQQTIGQPTFGRQKAGQYGPRPQQTFTGSKQGLITKGSPQTFDPNRQRSIA